MADPKNNPTPAAEIPDADKSDTDMNDTGMNDADINDTLPIDGDNSAQQEIARLKAELQEANNSALRAQAEIDNVRKRFRREAEDDRRYANLPLMRDLLPVMDNMQRAMAAAEKSHDVNTLIEGVKMVAQNLESALKQYHCKRIEAQGQPFDPAYHQAVMQQPSTDVPANTVLQVVQDGYTLNDRVVRPAQVIVSTEPAS